MKNMGITQEQYDEYKRLDMSQGEYLEFLQYREMKEKGFSAEDFAREKFMQDHNLTQEQYEVYERYYKDLELGVCMFKDSLRYNLTLEDYRIYEEHYEQSAEGMENFFDYLELETERRRNLDQYLESSTEYNLAANDGFVEVTLLRGGYYNDCFHCHVYRMDLNIVYLEESGWSKSSLSADSENTRIEGNFDSGKVFLERLQQVKSADEDNAYNGTLFFYNAPEDIKVDKLTLADRFVFDLEQETAYLK